MKKKQSPIFSDFYSNLAKIYYTTENSFLASSVKFTSYILKTVVSKTYKMPGEVIKKHFSSSSGNPEKG